MKIETLHRPYSQTVEVYGDQKHLLSVPMQDMDELFVKSALQALPHLSLNDMGNVIEAVRNKLKELRTPRHRFEHLWEEMRSNPLFGSVIHSLMDPDMREEHLKRIVLNAMDIGAKETERLRLQAQHGKINSLAANYPWR